MQLKDHYKTLQVAPHASTAEIKKAYRILAKQYHPDVVGSDPYAAAIFADIKEAYETLTQPHKKDRYLQERWYQKSQGTIHEKPTLTPVNILKDLLAFEKSCHQVDVFRMNKTALFREIGLLISSEKIGVLKQFNDPSINEQIVRCFVTPLLLLQANDARSLANHLLPLVPANSTAGQQLRQNLKRLNTQNNRQRWQWLWVLLITLLLCLLIEWVSK
jgi:hypothetical protein